MVADARQIVSQSPGSAHRASSCGAAGQYVTSLHISPIEVGHDRKRRHLPKEARVWFARQQFSELLLYRAEAISERAASSVWKASPGLLLRSLISFVPHCFICLVTRGVQYPLMSQCGRYCEEVPPELLAERAVLGQESV